MKREVYMDVARALAMFLVVFGHIIVYNDVRGYSAPSAQMIYSFHTALFMFVSVWFFPNILRKDWKTVIKEKTCQLLLPYLGWSIICLMLIDLPISGFDVCSCFSDFLMGEAVRKLNLRKIVVAKWQEKPLIRRIITLM